MQLERGQLVSFLGVQLMLARRARRWDERARHGLHAAPRGQARHHIWPSKLGTRREALSAGLLDIALAVRSTS